MTHGQRLRERLGTGVILPFCGVYDVFSATLAARYFDALFVSGFGFAASHHGLPDIGFIAWSDLVQFTERIRRVVPDHHLLVDIDDGYCDTEVACHVVRQLEQLGASAVVLEDQKRPRCCGHMDGKQVLDLEDYLPKLKAVLGARRDLMVVARTDATAPEEILRRVVAFAEAGCDAVLADGIKSLDLLREVAQVVKRPVAFNQLAGGKSPVCSLTELSRNGASLVIYSTPCLFAAQTAVEKSLRQLVAEDGSLHPLLERDATLGQCNEILFENLRVNSQ
jgi:2-methylisocitrate lyase-like PEP mutase family enzyme